MIEIKTRLLGVTLESFYVSPMPYHEVNLPAIAARSLAVFSSYGLKASQINVKKNDDIFNYELSFTLFGGSALFRVNHEKIEIQFQNASQSDGEVIMNCIANFFGNVPLPDIARTNIAAHSHADIGSAEKRHEFLIRAGACFNVETEIGITAYMREPGWSQEIRFVADRSAVFPDCLFVSWETGLGPGMILRKDLETLAQACIRTAWTFGLSYK